MAGNELFRTQLRHFSPHTYNALTKLVMAAAKVVKNTGKRTLFGKDKGQESYSRFLETLQATLQCMVLDGLVRESCPSAEVLDELNVKTREFSLAHPNWQDAYGFFDVYFKQNREDAIAVIERLRGGHGA